MQTKYGWQASYLSVRLSVLDVFSGIRDVFHHYKLKLVKTNGIINDLKVMIEQAGLV